MRVIVDRIMVDNVHYIEAAGTSEENKPTVNICGGSTFIETDTGDVFVFNETAHTWTQFGAASAEP